VLDALLRPGPVRGCMSRQPPAPGARTRRGKTARADCFMVRSLDRGEGVQPYEAKGWQPTAHGTFGLPLLGQHLCKTPPGRQVTV